MDMSVLRVGQVVYGYCGGRFGRDSYSDKRVEAIGADWVVCRTTGGNEEPVLFCGDPESLLAYTTAPEPDGHWLPSLDAVEVPARRVVDADGRCAGRRVGQQQVVARGDVER